MDHLPLKTIWIIARRMGFFLVAIFAPARTFDYWQAWVFLAVVFMSESMLVIYLYRKDRALLLRRLKGGSRAEIRQGQKNIMKVMGLSFILMTLVSGFDHRFLWSHVPAMLVLLADAAILASFLLTFRVFRENSFAAGTIQIADGQKVVSTGPYAVVRHPMYSAAMLINLCMPVALGSWWGLPFFVVNVGLIALRLCDEEKMLRQDLTGYPGYCEKVRYRILPGIW